MVAIVLMGILFGIGLQSEYNVVGKEPTVIEKTVEVPVEKVIEVEVDKIVEVPVEVEKVIYVKPKARCELVIEK